MDIVQHVKTSILNAEQEISKLCPEILKYQGYSGTRTRHFYNNICSLENASYLEIGTWYGSSSISALYKNTLNATFVDNWSQFNGDRTILDNAILKYNTGSKVTVLETDCWAIDVATLPKFDIYLYDGGHTYKDHYDAIAKFIHCLKPNCIVMVDDWNWDDIRNGTMDAFRDLGVKFLFQHEIRVPPEDLEGMPKHNGKDTWWNGIGIFVLDKST